MSMLITHCRLWRWIMMGSLGFAMCEIKSGRQSTQSLHLLYYFDQVFTLKW
ncbi:hypothetical protein K443DRAFT_420832, partial [Laccaria amethystina LaAM-08-1]